jgi:hypothetical protein
LFPGFDEAVASDLRTSLDLFLDDVVWSKESDFRRLLLADELYLNGRLSKLYGGDLPENADFQKVRPPTPRVGILSHPLLMTGFAYHTTSSPIHRGVFVARSLLGRLLRPPPDAVVPLPPELHPDLTTRDRITLQTKGAACQTCHALINPLGFTLENFDAIGRYRADEGGRAVDPTGEYLTRDGETRQFAGARELAVFLADSPETHAAFVEQLFQYLVKQPIRAFGPDRLQQLQQAFERQGCNVQKLMVEIVAATAENADDSQKQN